MRNVLLITMLAVTLGCMTHMEPANPILDNQTATNIDNMSVTANYRNATNPRTTTLTNIMRIQNIARPSDELVEDFVNNVPCARWGLINAQFESLNITAVSCRTYENNEWALGKCPGGESCCQCYYVFNGSGFEILNAKSLGKMVIIDTKEKALDFVKAVLQSGIFYKWHMGDWYYDKGSLKNAGCMNADNANLTSVMETPEGYFVTVLRRVQYQCVKPELFEEHYFVSYEGNFTGLSNAEIGQCDGDEICYD